MFEDLLEDAASRMELVITHTQGEFSSLRTGRANPAFLSRVTVDYYGVPTALQQLASTTVPEPQMLIVTPYDPGVLDEIEKALQTSGLGLNPSNDGKVIRLVFPTLTEERRRELIKVARNMAEQGRISIRNIRRGVREDLNELDEAEDDVRRAEKRLQEQHDLYIARIEEILKNKERDLLEV